MLNMRRRWRLLLTRHSAYSMAKEVKIKGIPLRAAVGNTGSPFKGVPKPVGSGEIDSALLQQRDKLGKTQIAPKRNIRLASFVSLPPPINMGRKLGD